MGTRTKAAKKVSRRVPVPKKASAPDRLRALTEEILSLNEGELATLELMLDREAYVELSRRYREHKTGRTETVPVDKIAAFKNL